MSASLALFLIILHSLERFNNVLSIARRRILSRPEVAASVDSKANNCTISTSAPVALASLSPFSSTLSVLHREGRAGARRNLQNPVNNGLEVQHRFPTEQ